MHKSKAVVVGPIVEEVLVVLTMCMQCAIAGTLVGAPIADKLHVWCLGGEPQFGATVLGNWLWCGVGVDEVGPFRLMKPIGWLICCKMPVAKAPICEWMYTRKVNEVHQPCFCIVAAEVTMSRRAMVPPAQRE